jgi:hypothetical protein
VIKLAKDNPIKCSIPGANRSFHAWNKGELVACVIHGADEDLKGIHVARHPDDFSQITPLDPAAMDFDPRQRRFFDSLDGESKLVVPAPTLGEVRDRVKRETSRLHWTVKRLQKPHTVKVSLSPHVFGLRSVMTSKNHLIQADA